MGGPRPSSIDRLPPDILERLHALLRDPRISQTQTVAEINAILEREGAGQRISRSALNRYAQKMNAVGERLQQSRQVAEMWIAKLGAAPQGEVGKLVNEILRTLAFDLTLTLQSGEITEARAPAVAKMLKEMSIAMERLEKAASENVKRTEEIRRQAAEEAAEVAEKVARQGGLSADSVQELRRAILGVRA